MQQDIYKHIEREVAAARPFAVATVIAVRGSSSAKPGAKALINAEGRNVFGWVGGGCADAFVRGQAVEAMAAGQPRTVQVDLDDEVFGLGMPCGGVMDVFIDPQTPALPIAVPVPPSLHGLASDLCYRLGLRLDALPTTEIDLSTFVVRLARQVAMLRGKSGAPMGTVACEAAPRTREQPSALVLCGSSRITEELARLGVLLKWPVIAYSFNPEAQTYVEGVTVRRPGAGFRDVEIPEGAVVVVAAHHKGDPEYIERAFAAGARYVGLVASRKRSTLVTESLTHLGMAPERLATLRAPAGLDIGCRTPVDIALSIIAEVIDTTISTTVPAPEEDL